MKNGDFTKVWFLCFMCFRLPVGLDFSGRGEGKLPLWIALVWCSQNKKLSPKMLSPPKKKAIINFWGFIWYIYLIF